MQVTKLVQFTNGTKLSKILRGLLTTKLISIFFFHRQVKPGGTPKPGNNSSFHVIVPEEISADNFVHKYTVAAIL